MMLPWPVKETDFRFRERERFLNGDTVHPQSGFIVSFVSPHPRCSAAAISCCCCWPAAIVPSPNILRWPYRTDFLFFFSFQQSGAQFKQLIQLRPHAYRTILRAGLFPRKFCKIFQISRHIESLDTCMKH
jgi:hypothetical protein